MGVCRLDWLDGFEIQECRFYRLFVSIKRLLGYVNRRIGNDELP